MSWKQWMVALSTVVLTTQFAPANADSYNRGNDCGYNFCDCDPCEGWSIYADYLYWRARNCDLDYAVAFRNIGSTVPVPGDTKSIYGVCPSYDSGFRVGILKACDDMDFAIHYTYFHSKDHSSVFNPDGLLARTQLGDDPAFTVNGDIQFAEGKYSIELNQIDLEAGYHLELNDCFAARLFGGFRYARIKQTFVSYYAEVNETPLEFAEDYIYQHSDLDFYGLYFGNKASYNICDCFDVFAGFSLGLGVADVDRKYRAEGALEFADLLEYDRYINLSDDCWRSVAVLDLNVGITIPLCNVCCTDWAISFGYEFHHWFNTGGFLNYNEVIDTNDDGEVVTTDYDIHLDHNTSDIGFDGLFVRLSAAF